MPFVPTQSSLAFHKIILTKKRGPADYFGFCDWSVPSRDCADTFSWSLITTVYHLPIGHNAHLLEGIECFCVHSWECHHPWWLMAQCFLYSQASPAGCQLPTHSIHCSSIQLLHLLWCWLVSEKHQPCSSTFLTAWTPKIDLCYCEICVCVCVHMDTHTHMYIHTHGAFQVTLERTCLRRQET